MLNSLTYLVLAHGEQLLALYNIVSTILFCLFVGASIALIGRLRREPPQMSRRRAALSVALGLSLAGAAWVLGVASMVYLWE